MHYYKRNIGDYAKKAGKLSMLQHGAYSLLLDAYYDREYAPTKEEAIEWCWASTPEEIAAVEFLLSRYFRLVNGRYVQNKCEEELEEYRLIAEKNRENGKRGGRPKINPVGFQSVPSGNPAISQNNPLESESNHNQEPVTSNQEPNIHIVPGKPATPSCPHQEIIDSYHEILPTGTQVKIWNDARKKALQARWREEAKRQSLDWWRKLFAYCAQSPFLTSQIPPSAGRTQFVIALDWIVNPTNFAKIIEGKYHGEAAA